MLRVLFLIALLGCSSRSAECENLECGAGCTQPLGDCYAGGADSGCSLVVRGNCNPAGECVAPDGGNVCR